MTSSRDDYRWIRGANYLPSFATNTVEAWRDFDAATIDRELGFAERLDLNSLRVFLQHHVYEHDPSQFLRNVETLVTLCDKHRLRPMLAVFDGCFGVAPSMSSSLWWVASPGGPRTNPDFYPEGEKYCRDLVGLFRGDSRLLMWDAMNEPEAATFYAGEPAAYGFARHFAEYLKEVDPTHPVTVGLAHAENNAQVADVVDAISFHPYAGTREDLLVRLERARTVAAGKPVIASETGMPFWGCPYELVLPFFREQGVGAYFWELMIGRDALASTGGIFYPDGTVRRLSHVEAVLGREAVGFVKKPDREGVPLAPMKGPSVLAAGQLDRLTGTPTDDENAWERFTVLWSVANPLNFASQEADYLRRQVEELRTLMEQGRTGEAYPRIEALLREARGFHWSAAPIFHPDVTTCGDEEGSA